MSATGFDVLADIVGRLNGVRDLGNEQYEARCPAHEDRRQSLSFGRGKNGGVVMKCHAECDTKDVLRAIGMEMKDLMPPNDGFKPSGKAKKSKPFGTIVAEYDYTDAGGKLLYQALRLDPKDFRQRSPNGTGGWEWKLNGAPRVLYRLPELLAADPQAVVFIPEGEKDVNRLYSLGLVATTNVMGAGKWLPEYSESLRGRHVVVIADNDNAGRMHALKVIVSLRGIAASVKILALPGLPEKGDVSDWLDSGGTAEELLRLASEASEEMPEQEKKSASDNTSHGARLTDWGNAQRLVARHGSDFRYCFPDKTTYVWNGTHWEEDKTGEIERRAKDTVRQLWRDAAAEDDSDRRKEMMKHAHASEKAERLRSMISVAKSEPGVPIMPEQLDQDNFLLCCPNCVVDLRTGQQRPHRREDYITKLCPTRFNPDAPSYHWDRFVESIFDGKESLVGFARRLAGYAITGDVSEQIFTIAHGGGSNGKSTWLNAMLTTLGPNYPMQAMAELLMEKKNAQHSTERAELRGMRLVCCTESGDGKPIDEAFIKQLTGGERIRARKCFKDNTEFSPTFKVVLCTNHRPTIRGTDHGIWRRIALLPFVVKFWDPDKGESGPEELRVDKSLKMKLEAEAEGILAWCVRGCVEWQRHGLQVPAEVREATGQYRAAQDRIGQFIQERCTAGSMVQVRANSLYADYRAWTEQRGEYPVSQTKFGEAITERGIEKRVSNGVWYIGIATLRDDHGR